MSLPDRDFVRELIQDRTEPYKVSDDFIDRVLTDEGDVYLAASRACRTLSARYATEARSKSIGGLSISLAGKSSDYLDLAREYGKIGKEKVTLSGVPYAGGLDRDDLNTRREDTDTLQTVTRLGMHERPDPMS